MVETGSRAPCHFRRAPGSRTTAVETTLRPSEDPQLLRRATQPPPGREQQLARATILMDCRAEMHQRVRKHIWVLPEQEIEDVTADIIALFIERDALWVKYDPSRPIRHWVCGVAEKRARTTLRNVTRRSFLQRLYRATLGDDSYVPESPLDLARGVQDGEFTDERMRRALERLPEKTRELVRAFYLHQGEQPTSEELAVRMGTSASAIRKQLERARKRLFQEYNDECAKEEA